MAPRVLEESLLYIEVPSPSKHSSFLESLGFLEASIISKSLWVGQIGIFQEAGWLRYQTHVATQLNSNSCGGSTSNDNISVFGNKLPHQSELQVFLVGCPYLTSLAKYKGRSSMSNMPYAAEQVQAAPERLQMTLLSWIILCESKLCLLCLELRLWTLARQFSFF